MVKDIGRASSKWQTNAANAQADYRAGVQGKGGKWQSNAAAAEGLWAQRIQEAIASGSRVAGINAVGGTNWEQATINKGSANYLTGVRDPMSVAKYQQNFGPILSAIASAVQALPPRGPPMSAENLQRAQAIWQAVHNAAQARRGGGVTPTGTYGTTPTYGGGF